jgi:hypothetical protein
MPNYRIPDVPYISQDDQYLCVPASFQMCLEYLYKKGKISKQLDFIAICKLLKTTNLGSAWNPPITQKKFKKEIPNLNVIQTSNSNLPMIVSELGNNMPSIVHFNLNKLEFDVRGTSGHAAVVVGKTPENLIVHDPFKKQNHKVYIEDFMDAWRIENKRLTRFKFEVRPMSLDRWSKNARD